MRTAIIATILAAALAFVTDVGVYIYDDTKFVIDQHLNLSSGKCRMFVFFIEKEKNLIPRFSLGKSYAH
jgi:hypothetical protein